MFAFLVRRLLSGFLVIVLVSLAVFTLFFYGPKSPALELCRRDTNNRCVRPRPSWRTTRRTWATTTRCYSEYAKWVKGLFVGRTITIGATEYDCPAPCLGISYRDRTPVTEQLKERFPATLGLALGGASSTCSSA